MHYEPHATSVGDFLITARSLAEYRAMFTLTDADLHGRILDCPGGASSFTAEANELGAQTIAIDPAYGMSMDALAEHATSETERGTAWADATSRRYVWDFYGDLAGHQRMRRAAAARFVEDLRAHPDRYLPGRLPSLSFPDNVFDLVLSSHLLFTYTDRLDFDFHLAAMTELSRVSAGDVRIFPLVDQAGSPQTGLVSRLRTALGENGIRSRITEVNFEFQRGSRSMLDLLA